MARMRTCCLVVTLALAGVSPAFAQGASVGVSLTGDVARFSRSETGGVRDLSGSGEAIGFALRAGTALGSNWGVEVELARPSRIENEGAPDFLPLAYPNLPPLGAGAGVEGTVVPGLGVLIYPPISYRIRTSQRNTTFSAGAWARQILSARAALVYSGGVGFQRTERDVEFSYGPVGGLIAAPAILPPSVMTRTTVYSTRPFVGLDARIGMTDHLELVAGVRLHGLENGLLVRPGIGLGWTF